MSLPVLLPGTIFLRGESALKGGSTSERRERSASEGGLHPEVGVCIQEKRVCFQGVCM